MGRGLGKMIAGGALAGFGDSLIQRAEHKREIALKMIDAQNLASRERANREFQGGLIGSTEVAEDGNVYGITRSGERKDLGFKGRKSGLQMREERMQGEITGEGGSTSGLSIEADRQKDAILETSKERDGEGYETVNMQKYVAGLKATGNPELVALADSLEKAGAATPKPLSEDPDWKEAGKDAEKWAKEQEGWISTKGDFKDYVEGGNRQDAILKKRWELFEERKLRGSGGQRTGLAPGMADPNAPEDPAEKPDGSASEYKSAEEVRDAYRAGKISREEAMQILRAQFGME